MGGGMTEDYGQKRTEDAIRKFVEQSHAERLSALAGAKELGLHSIKALVALNGGAMLAQLTFVAALFGKEAAQGTRMAIALAGRLEVPFQFFGFGLILAIAAGIFAYLNTWGGFRAYPEPSDLKGWMEGKSLPDTGRFSSAYLSATAYFSSAAGIASGVAFALGMIQSVALLSEAAKIAVRPMTP